ncbi:MULTISPECIES: radical SAM/SPASM domain-containing protein [Thermus]|nr:MULTISPECIES: radical SAM protein [Thermus]ULR39848.1 SPASM domain-containing protein [Thermus sp. NEB1569]
MLQLLVVNLHEPAQAPARGGAAYKPSRFNHFHTLLTGEKLAFNSLSGGLAVLDSEGWARYTALVKGEPLDPKNPVDQGLVEGRFVVPENFDELAYLKTLHLRQRYTTEAWSLTICPTIDCNFGCDYCFQRHRVSRMTEAVQAKLLEVFAQKAPRLSKFFVTWFGGEPTLAWDVVQRLSQGFLEVAERNRVEYSASLITNGYLLDEGKVADMVRYRIHLVQITLDGDAPYHDQRRHLLTGEGSFERILANLRLFLGKPVFVHIRVNVDVRNREGVPALLKRLAEEGLAHQENLRVYFAPVTSTAPPSHGVKGFCFTRKDFARIEPEYFTLAESLGLATLPYPSLQLGGCVAAHPEGFVVEPDGTLQKCWDTVGQPEFAVGNLLEYDPLQLAENPVYQRWMSWDPFSEELACSRCTWLPACMGGCPLKVVFPEAMPEGKVELECTTFKWNWKRTFTLLAERAGEAEPAPRPCTG